MARRDLSLKAQRFAVLTTKRGGKRTLVGERYVRQSIKTAKELDRVVANIERAVTGLVKYLSYEDDLSKEKHVVTREQAIDLLTPWARENERDRLGLRDRMILALLENDRWEPDRNKRFEVIERVCGIKSAKEDSRAADVVVSRAKTRRAKRQRST